MMAFSSGLRVPTISARREREEERVKKRRRNPPPPRGHAAEGDKRLPGARDPDQSWLTGG